MNQRGVGAYGNVEERGGGEGGDARQMPREVAGQPPATLFPNCTRESALAVVAFAGAVLALLLLCAPISAPLPAPRATLHAPLSFSVSNLVSPRTLVRVPFDSVPLCGATRWAAPSSSPTSPPPPSTPATPTPSTHPAEPLTFAALGDALIGERHFSRRSLISEYSFTLGEEHAFPIVACGARNYSDEEFAQLARLVRDEYHVSWWLDSLPASVMSSRGGMGIDLLVHSLGVPLGGVLQDESPVITPPRDVDGGGDDRSTSGGDTELYLANHLLFIITYTTVEELPASDAPEPEPRRARHAVLNVAAVPMSKAAGGDYWRDGRQRVWPPPRAGESRVVEWSYTVNYRFVRDTSSIGGGEAASDATTRALGAMRWRAYSLTSTPESSKVLLFSQLNSFFSSVFVVALLVVMLNKHARERQAAAAAAAAIAPVAAERDGGGEMEIELMPAAAAAVPAALPEPAPAPIYPWTRFLRRIVAPPQPEDHIKIHAIRHDVFRAPPRPAAYAGIVGFGTQTLVATLVMIVAALAGVVSPLRLGEALAAGVLVFALASIAGGYASTLTYRLLMRAHAVEIGAVTRSMVLMLACMPPLVVLVLTFATDMAIALEYPLAARGSGLASPAATGAMLGHRESRVALLFLLWLACSVVLSLVGRALALRVHVHAPPQQVNAVPRQVPPQQWYYGLPMVLMLGTTTYGVMHVPLHFLRRGVVEDGGMWFAIGSLLSLFILLLVNAAAWGACAAHMILRREDHRWWWRTLLAPASSGALMFVSLMADLVLRGVRSDVHADSLATMMVYLGCSALASVALAGATAAVGFCGSLVLVHRLFRRDG